MKDNDNLIYFQEWLDENTMVNGYIDKITEQGKAHIYKKKDTVHFDLIKNGVKKEPYTKSEKVAQIAYESLKRSN